MVNSPAAAQLEALRGYYQLHFAHRPRASRSLSMLEKLREQVHALAHAAGPSEARGVQTQAQQLAHAWGEEATAIAKAQKDAQTGDWLAIEAAEEAQRLLWRTARLQVLHPAPQAARPHQLQLLAAELRAGKDGVATALGAVASGPPPAALQRAEQNLAHALGHVEALRAGAIAARHAADLPLRLSAAVQGARAALRDLAEAVAGRTPLVVRPTFLEGLVVDLKEAAVVLEEAARAGFGGDEHRQNCIALAEQVSSWQVQLRQVVAKRRQHTADELAHALGEEADAVMEAADALLGGPSDRQARAYLALRMDELHRQLVGVPLLFGHAQHKETLAGLADCLAWLEA